MDMLLRVVRTQTSCYRTQTSCYRDRGRRRTAKHHFRTTGHPARSILRSMANKNEPTTPSKNAPTTATSDEPTTRDYAWSSSGPSGILEPGSRAPGFTLHSTPDQTVSLSDFRGQP